MARLRRRRYLFKKQRGKCFHCKEPMLFREGELPKGEHHPPMLATVDHLDDRFSPLRGKSRGGARTVLACYSCNWKRGVERQAEQPIEVLWARSGFYTQPPLAQIAAE